MNTEKIWQLVDTLEMTIPYLPAKTAILSEVEETIAELRQAIEQAEQAQPVTYDKTKLNCFAQDLYDQKMREGKHGHYEAMFHVIHQCIKRVAPQPRKPEQEKQEYPDNFIDALKYDLALREFKNEQAQPRSDYRDWDYQDQLDEQAEKQEPLAWMHNLIEGNVITHRPVDIGRHPERWTPLYTAPPKKEWVELTKEDMPDGDNPMFDTNEFYAGMAWAAAKLKEKNSG